jgi:uncharacterized OB-fold protein
MTTGELSQWHASDPDNYLPPGLAAPRPWQDGLDTPYWEAIEQNRLVVQYCDACDAHQWGPEWICHRCHKFDLEYVEIEPKGKIYSWERVWHPVHPALQASCPYMVVLVELPGADNVRMVGNLLGDPLRPITIGEEVEAVFEHHKDVDPPYTLVQWKRVGD